MHLGGRLGARRHLELDLDPVEGVLLAGLLDVKGGHDEGDLPCEPTWPSPHPTWPCNPRSSTAPYM